MQIRMITEQIEELAARMRLLSLDLFEAANQIQLAARQRSNWDGPVAQQFSQRLDRVGSKLHLFAEEATKLYLDAAFEEDEWITTDQQGVIRIKRARQLPPQGSDPSLGRQIDYLSDEIENYIFDKRYQNFKNWWESQSLDDKKKYLQELQNRLADKYGMPRMLLVIDDLPDGANTDFRGLNIDRILILDLDNLNTDDPWRLIETMFHETRHDFQRQAVAVFNSTGQVPQGLTKEQVEQWAYELTPGNYIDGTENFEDYYNQALEKDARKYGDIYMRAVLDEMGQTAGGSGGGAW